MAFERVEADGSVYYYDGKNFFDEYFLVLQGDDLRRATEAYFSQFDYTKYNAEEILVYIKKLKYNQMYSQTKGVMDYATTVNFYMHSTRRCVGNFTHRVNICV
jgi:hypothetical protein